MKRIEVTIFTDNRDAIGAIITYLYHLKKFEAIKCWYFDVKTELDEDVIK